MYVFGGYQFLIIDPTRNSNTYPATSGGGQLFYFDPNEAATYKTVREFNFYPGFGIPANGLGDLLSVAEGDDGELYAMFANGDVKRIAAPPLAGDYNGNGTVDAADYVVWRDNVGTTNSLSNDLIGGVIGPDHYNQWKSNFGATNLLQSSASGLAVPEPRSCILALLSLLAELACVRSLVLRSKRAAAR